MTTASWPARLFELPTRSVIGLILLLNGLVIAGAAVTHNLPNWPPSQSDIHVVDQTGTPIFTFAGADNISAGGAITIWNDISISNSIFTAWIVMAVLVLVAVLATARLSEQPGRLQGLFELFDLDPKASFKVTGEQIDGAFTFDGTDYLLEAKWQKDPVRANDLDSLAGKLSRKLDNTLGLYLAINGYSVDGVKAHSSGRRLMLLMDGSDLMAVLEGRIDLVQLLLRKRRAAAQTGNIYVKIHEILTGGA